MNELKKVRVVCAIIINDNQVFCCRRGPGRAMEGYWEFPGGKIKEGESSFDAIKREIKEELNTEIQPLESIGESHHDYLHMEPYTDFHIDMEGILCKVISGNLESSEHTASKWLSYDQLHDVEWAPADKPIVELIIKTHTGSNNIN